MKKLIILALTSILLLAGCTSEQDAASENKGTSQTTSNSAAPTETGQVDTVTSSEIPEKVKEKLKIAVIVQFAIGTFSTQYIEGVTEQVEAFGGEVQVYNSDNDLSKMATHLETAVNSKVDGIIISHGRAEALEAGVKKAVAANIPVVSFDSDLQVEGVTVLDQDDYSLAWKSLKSLAEDFNGEAKIATIWVGGFTPMERRKVMIDAFYKRYPNVKEVATFGSVSNNTMLDTQAQVDALLKQYPKGELDAIFAAWDEFAKGAVKAIQAAGRTEVKVYGIDLTDEDLQIIQEENSPWVVSAAVDPADSGRVQARFLYQKIAGEETPDFYSLEPNMIDQDQLPDEKITVGELSQHVEDWKASTAATSPWMDALVEENK